MGSTLERVPQFTTRIDGQTIHFLHVTSPEPGALPLIVTHDWPGSVVELMNIVAPARLEAARQVRRDGTGYADIQATRPSTLSYALNDSPVGQLAWIVEKFKEWTVPAKELPEDAVDRDQLFTNVTLYWLTGTGASAAHLYYEVRTAPIEPAERTDVPPGIAVFPSDPAIRRLVEREHNVVHSSEFNRGGHSAAMEAPDLLVGDVRAFFRGVR